MADTKSVKLLWVGVFSLTALLLGVLYWCSMSGWIAYINIDWYPAQCLVTNLARYNITRFNFAGDVRQETYTRIDVQVNTSGTWVSGYACGSSLAHRQLEYHFSVCDVPDACGRELLLPRWACSYCSACTYLVSDEPLDCQWSFHAAGEPEGEQHSYPANDRNLLHVAFDEEVYWGPWKFVLAQLLAAVVLAAVFGAEILCAYDYASS